jgi:hypothetical protein
MWVYASFALFSTWKFMFTPMAGPAAGLTFWETFLACVFGGYFSVSLFYFGSNYFMEQHRLRQIKRRNKRLAKGKKIIEKPIFSHTNRSIVQFKTRTGFVTTCWLFPLFLSLPLGSIVTAKFYKHKKLTFVYIMLGVTLNCLLITGGTYIVYDLTH